MALLWTTAGDEVRKKELHELDKERKALQVEQEEEKLKGIKQQNHDQEIASNLAHIEKLVQIKELVNSNEVDAVKLINSPYIRHNIDTQLQKVHEKTMLLMKRNNFDIDSNDISIIDLKV